MRYYKLLYDYENDDNWVYCKEEKLEGNEKYLVYEGKQIHKWDEVEFKYNSKEGAILSDYIANAHRWLIVSPEFCRLTESVLSSEVQYLPVKLIDTNEKTENNAFQVVNIINLVDALDLEKSKYDVFELDDKKIISVQKYALKRKSIENSHIFRLKDDTIPVFVSEDIKKIVEENDLLGFSFLEVEVS